MALGLIAAAALVLANGFFVATELELARVRPTQVDEWERRGRPGARSVRHAVEHIDAYLAACQRGLGQPLLPDLVPSGRPSAGLQDARSRESSSERGVLPRMERDALEAVAPRRAASVPTPLERHLWFLGPASPHRRCFPRIELEGVGEAGAGGT